MRKPRPAAEGAALKGDEGRVCVGVVTGPHGIKGAVRIKSFTADPEDIAAYGRLADETGRRHFDLTLLGVAKGVVLAVVSGVADRNGAEALRGMRLYLPRAALPPPAEDEYYHADLIGLDAVLADGTVVGQVRAIHDFGAGDVLELGRAGMPPLVVPFTRAVVPLVDLAAGQIVIDPPEGLLKPEKPSPPKGGEGRVRGARSGTGHPLTPPLSRSGEREKQRERRK